MNMRQHFMQGLGESAICPSVEQLMGVTDLSDPCQGSSFPIATPALDAIVYGSLTPAQMSAVSGVPVAAQTNATAISPWVIAAAAALLILVLKR